MYNVSEEEELKSDSLSFHGLMQVDCVFAARLCLSSHILMQSDCVFLKLDITSVCLLTV